MTLRKALEPPDPGGADSDPRLGSFLLASAPFFFFFLSRCPLQKTKPGGLSGLPPKSGNQREGLPTSGGGTIALLGLGDGVCVAEQQIAHQNRNSLLLGAYSMLRHYAKCFIPPYPSQQPREIGNSSPHFVDEETKARRS